MELTQDCNDSSYARPRRQRQERLGLRQRYPLSGQRRARRRGDPSEDEQPLRLRHGGLRRSGELRGRSITATAPPRSTCISTAIRSTPTCAAGSRCTRANTSPPPVRPAGRPGLICTFKSTRCIPMTPRSANAEPMDWLRRKRGGLVDVLVHAAISRRCRLRSTNGRRASAATGASRSPLSQNVEEPTDVRLVTIDRAATRRCSRSSRRNRYRRSASAVAAGRRLRSAINLGASLQKFCAFS